MKSSVLVVRWIWVALATCVLLLSLISFDGRPNSDADVLLAYGMLMLSFPISLVVALLAGAVGQLAYSLLGHVFTVSYSNIVVGWLVFFAAGYWQWFVVIPWLYRKIRTALSRTRDASTDR